MKMYTSIFESNYSSDLSKAEIISENEETAKQDLINEIINFNQNCPEHLIMYVPELKEIQLKEIPFERSVKIYPYEN